MNKFLLIPTISLILLAFAKSNAQKIDSVISFTYDTAQHQFILSSKQAYTYKNCYQTKYEYSLWDTAQLKYTSSFKTTNSLLANNNISQTLSQLWDDVNNKWVNFQKAVYTYNVGATNPSKIVYQLYNTANNSWYNDKTYTYYSNQAGIDTAILIEQWNTSQNKWENYLYYVYTYNNQGKLAKFNQQNWNASNAQWKNNLLINYTYNQFNKVMSDSAWTWKTSSSLWVPYYKNSYQYNSSNYLQSYIYQYWDSALQQFAPAQMYIYTNNAVGQAIELLTLNYTNTSLSWDTLYKDVYSYNSCALPIATVQLKLNENKSLNALQLHWNTISNNQVTSYYIQQSTNGIDFTDMATTNSNTNQFAVQLSQLQASNTYYYRVRASYNNTETVYSNIVQYNYKSNLFVEVYPNPASSKINISIKPSNYANGYVTLALYNSLGKMVYEKKYTATTQNILLPLNNMNLPNGLYYVQVSQAEQIIRKAILFTKP